MRQAARRHDDDIGPFREDRIGLGPGVVADVDAELLALRQPPVDDAHHLVAARALRGKPDLAAGRAGRLEDNHLVAALAGDPGRLQPARTRPYDNYLPLARRLWNDMRHRQFAAGRGVMDAIGRAALIDAVQAVVRAHAGTYLVLALFHDFAHRSEEHTSELQSLMRISYAVFGLIKQSTK